jgi:hypothetical protein
MVLSVVALAPGSLLRAQVTQLPTENVQYDYRWEAYGAGSYMRFKAGPTLPSINMYGFNGEVTHYLREHWGWVASGRGYYGTTDVLPNPYKLTTQSVKNYMFLGGGQYRLDRNERLSFTVHALAGGNYGIFNPDVNYPGGGKVNPNDVGLFKNQLAFGAAFGGSVDFNVTHRLTVRIAPEATLTDFTGAFGKGGITAEYAGSVGVVYKFRRGLRY